MRQIFTPMAFVRARNVENVSIWWRYHGGSWLVSVKCLKHPSLIRDWYSPENQYCPYLMYLNLLKSKRGSEIIPVNNTRNNSRIRIKYIHDNVSKRNIFRVTSPLCEEFTGDRQSLVTRSFGVFFELRLNKRLRKQRDAGLWDAIPFIMTSLMIIRKMDWHKQLHV